MESGSIYFKFDDFVEPGTFVLDKNTYRYINMSFLNVFNDFDYFINAKIKIVTTSTIFAYECIKLFYFNDNSEKVYVDYGNKKTINSTNYIEFDITSFLATKKHLYKTLFIENSSLININLSKDCVNIFEGEYIHHNQLFGNKNVLTNQIGDYKYKYNYVSGELIINKPIFKNILFYDVWLSYCNKSKNLSHLFFDNGWNLNLFEYLDIDNDVPVSYVDQNNYLHELVPLEGTLDYYYTNDGSALILQKIVENNITTYKLFSELSSAFKLFDENGNLIKNQSVDNDYFEISYSGLANNQIEITDSKNNQILVSLDSNTNEVLISLKKDNSNYLTYSVLLNSNLEVASIGRGTAIDSLNYSNGKLVSINLSSNYKLELNYSGLYIASVIHKYGIQIIKKFDFAYDYLRTYITDEHGFKQIYIFDEELEQVSSGESIEDTDNIFYCQSKTRLTENIRTSLIDNNYRIGIIQNSLPYVVMNNENSDHQETRRFGFDPDSGGFTIKKDHKYVFMVTITKNSNVVFNDSRSLTINLLDYDENLICPIKINKCLRKQTVAIIFSSPFTESREPPKILLVRITTRNLSYFGGVTISNAMLFEAQKLDTTFYVRNDAGDSLLIPLPASSETIDEHIWSRFSTSIFEDTVSGSSVIRNYSYKDLLRDFINAEKDLPFFWDQDQKRLTYNVNQNRDGNYFTGGFQLFDKINYPGHTCIYAKKTIKKYYEDNSVEKCIYDFEYFEAERDNDNHLFFNHNLISFVGDDSYKIVKKYDSELKLIETIDYKTSIHQENVYNSDRQLIKTITSKPGYSPIIESLSAYDLKNRKTSDTNLVQDDFETSLVEFINNFEIINKTIDQNNVETSFQFDDELKNNTQLSSNNVSITKQYSNDRLECASNSTSFAFNYNTYNLNSSISIANQLMQQRDYLIETDTYVTKRFQNGSQPIRYRYDKYGNIATVSEFNSVGLDGLDLYDDKVEFLYFKSKPDNLNTHTSQSDDTQKNFKLYKIIDSWCSRRTIYDYDDYNKLIQFKVNDSSDNQIYKIDYDYDCADRLQSKKVYLNSSQYLKETYERSSLVENAINIINFNNNFSQFTNHNFTEETSFDQLNRVAAIEWSNSSSPRLTSWMYKMELNYVQKTIDNQIYTNNLVSRIDFSIPTIQLQASGPFGQLIPGIALTYSRSEYISYTPTSNIVSIAHGDMNNSTNNTGVAYSYDALDQLTQEINYDLNKQINYSYDNNGNILSIVETDLSTNTTSTLNYRYDSTYKDKLIAINDNIHENILYDEDLNITQIDNTYLDWTRGRLLESISKVIGTTDDGIDIHLTDEFIYNYEGIRTEKIDSLGEHIYLLEGHKILGEKITLDNQTIDVAYLYGQNGIFGFIYDGHMYYYQKNILGDITHIYDGTNLVCRYVYDAYGKHKVFDSNNNDITDDDPSTNIGLINPFRYRGYYYDIDFGLYYCNSRYYSPYLRRWINIDEFDYINPDDILGLNLFAYCKNNPIRYTDEEGKIAIWLSALIGLAIGLTTTFIKDLADDGKPFNGSVNWREYLGAGIGGSVGALGSGFVSTIILGGVSSVAQSLIEGNINSFSDFMISFSIGFVVGALEFGVSSIVKNIGSKKIIGIIGDSVDNNVVNRRLAEAGFGFLKIGKIGREGVFKYLYHYFKFDLIENLFSNSIDFASDFIPL